MSSLEDRIYASRFKIKIDENGTAERCHLKGSYTIHVSSTGIGLLDSRQNVVYSWPYHFIRRYGVENYADVFVIEAGRRCDSGEGYFRFKTHQAQEINRLVQDHLKRMSVSYNPVNIVGPSQKVAKPMVSVGSEESDKKKQLSKVHQSTAYSPSSDCINNSQGGAKAKKHKNQSHSEQVKLAKSGGPFIYSDTKLKEEEQHYTETDQHHYEII